MTFLENFKAWEQRYKKLILNYKNMKYTGILLIIFGAINIYFPDILAYILWGTCIMIGIGILLWTPRAFGKNKKNHAEPYVKFGNYKIYR